MYYITRVILVYYALLYTLIDYSFVKKKRMIHNNVIGPTDSTCINQACKEREILVIIILLMLL